MIKEEWGSLINENKYLLPETTNFIKSKPQKTMMHSTNENLLYDAIDLALDKVQEQDRDSVTSFRMVYLTIAPVRHPKSYVDT